MDQAELAAECTDFSKLHSEGYLAALNECLGRSCAAIGDRLEDGADRFNVDEEDALPFTDLPPQPRPEPEPDPEPDPDRPRANDLRR